MQWCSSPAGQEGTRKVGIQGQSLDDRCSSLGSGIVITNFQNSSKAFLFGRDFGIGIVVMMIVVRGLGIKSYDRYVEIELWDEMNVKSCCTLFRSNEFSEGSRQLDEQSLPCPFMRVWSLGTIIQTH